MITSTPFQIKLRFRWGDYNLGALQVQVCATKRVHVDRVFQMSIVMQPQGQFELTKVSSWEKGSEREGTPRSTVGYDIPSFFYPPALSLSISCYRVRYV